MLSNILSQEGSPSLKTTLKAIMSLALPAIVEQIMITMVQYVDTAMVGSLGSVATAAVGLTQSTSWLINGLMSAASVGFSVQVAQYVGARDIDKARNVTAQSIVFIAFFGILLAAAAFAVSFRLPEWLGADDAVRPLASSYFRIYSLAAPFNLCALMIGGAVRCAGDTKTPMLLNLSINVLNVILNFLFIYPSRTISILGAELYIWGAGMGVSGAALGSLLSLMTVSALYFVLLYFKPSPIRLSKGVSYRFTAPVLKNVWRIGLPVALERTTISLAQIVFTAIVSGIGTVAVAAHHLSVTAESLSYMPAYGAATAATTMVGQAIGAGRRDLAKTFGRLVTYIGIGIMVLGGLMLYLLASNLIMLFSNESPVIELGAKVLRIVAFAEPFFAMSIVITGVLRGAGDTKAPFIIGLISMWGVRIVLALLTAESMGLVGVWMAMAVDLAFRGVLFMVRLYRGKWLNHRVL